jgi:hypothetical protein
LVADLAPAAVFEHEVEVSLTYASSGLAAFGDQNLGFGDEAGGSPLFVNVFIADVEDVDFNALEARAGEKVGVVVHELFTGDTVVEIVRSEEVVDLVEVFVLNGPRTVEKEVLGYLILRTEEVASATTATGQTQDRDKTAERNGEDPYTHAYLTGATGKMFGNLLIRAWRALA